MYVIVERDTRTGHASVYDAATFTDPDTASGIAEDLREEQPEHFRYDVARIHTTEEDPR